MSIATLHLRLLYVRVRTNKGSNAKRAHSYAKAIFCIAQFLCSLRIFNPPSLREHVCCYIEKIIIWCDDDNEKGLYSTAEKQFQKKMEFIGAERV